MSILKSGAEHLGFSISTAQEEMFEKYKTLLIEWNKKFNLTAITDDRDIVLKHFLDSISVISVMGDCRENTKLMDIGAGAGFPGLPIKIMLDNLLDVTLMDSVGKKVTFMNEVISVLGLKNAEAVHSRAEDLASLTNYRESFDFVTARAVSKLNILAEYCLPFVKTGGKFISMKLSGADDEINEAKSAIKKLGGEISSIREIQIPFTDITHCLIVIDKISNTPPQYPRKAGKALKSPIR
jgi:16S rRNA (guanine527-N7)-methyltransferase